MTRAEGRRWCLMIHALPARPLYLRARIRRLLAQAGAAPIKKSAYVLPHSATAHEQLRSIAAEIRAAGGVAFVGDVTFDDAGERRDVVAAYNDTLHADYRAWMRHAADAVAKPGRGRAGAGRRPPARGGAEGLEGLRSRLAALNARDHFQAPGARQAAALLADLERRASPRSAAGGGRASLAGLRWVTRRGLLVDRLACAWVVRRFVDPSARFRFVAGSADHAVAAGEIGFDMPGAAIAHEDGGCSVETLVRRAGLDDPAVRRIAEIVHDIDLRDGRYGHGETPGFEQLMLGTIASIPSDDERLARGLPLFDALYAALTRGAALPAAPRPAPRMPARKAPRA